MSLISSINSNLQFPATSKLESSRNTTPANSIKDTSSAVVSSASSSINANNDASAGIKKIFDIVEADPEFAKQMDDYYAHTPDRETFSLADCPPLDDVQAWKEFQDKTNIFNSVADGVTAQRTDIYNSMKASSSSDVDIFKALMNFNKSLSMDYQLKAGLVKYDIYA